MPTVDIFPTHASFTEGWTGYDGGNEEASVGFINDSNLTTYVTSPEESDVEFDRIAISAFNNNSAYLGKVINSITLNITGKVLSNNVILTQQLTTTHRGSTGIGIALLGIVETGVINSTTTYTTLASPLTSVAIADNHIDDINLTLSVSEGRLLITEIFIRVDYAHIGGGHVELSSGLIQLTSGKITL